MHDTEGNMVARPTIPQCCDTHTPIVNPRDPA